MVWNGHGLKGDTLCVFEERVWPPELGEPFNGKLSVLGSRVVLGQTKTVVLPALGEKYVARVRLKDAKEE